MAAADHPPVTGPTRRLLVMLLVPLLAAVAVGAVALRPTGRGPDLPSSGTPVGATVTALPVVACADTVPAAGIRCIRPRARLAGGRTVTVAERPAGGGEGLAVGDEVVLTRTGSGTYALSAHRRTSPLLVATSVAAALVLLVARRRGLFLVLSLAASMVVVVTFVVPAVLDGRPALGVGVVGAALVAVLLTVVGRGVSARTATALVGALVGVGAAGLAADVVGRTARLAGLATGPASLHVAGDVVHARGLLVAGIVLGTVGALVDLALRQVDATWDLRDADPGAGWWGVTAAGLRHGGGHLADVAGTVVLAYAGAALPVLVLLAAADRSVADALTGEVLAVEVARAVVALGVLALAVPVTTALAALIVVREGADPRGADPRRFRSRRERDLWDGD